MDKDVDTTSALVAFFGYHENKSYLGHQSEQSGVNGIAHTYGVCSKSDRVSITEINRPSVWKDIDVKTTSLVSSSHI